MSSEAGELVRVSASAIGVRLHTVGGEPEMAPEVSHTFVAYLLPSHYITGEHPPRSNQGESREDDTCARQGYMGIAQDGRVQLQITQDRRIASTDVTY